jgi:hypothetical protein
MERGDATIEDVFLAHHLWDFWGLREIVGEKLYPGKGLRDGMTTLPPGGSLSYTIPINGDWHTYDLGGELVYIDRPGIYQIIGAYVLSHEGEWLGSNAVTFAVMEKTVSRSGSEKTQGDVDSTNNTRNLTDPFYDNQGPFGMGVEEYTRKYFTYDEKYYSTVDTSRLLYTRPLRPGEKPFRIQSRSTAEYLFAGKEKRESIKVLVPAQMPCTFYAEDGQFKENGTNCVTVKADQEGIASVHYVAGSSTSTEIRDAQIIARSPEAEGWVSLFFVVGVEKPEGSPKVKGVSVGQETRITEF